MILALIPASLERTSAGLNDWFLKGKVVLGTGQINPPRRIAVEELPVTTESRYPGSV